MATVEEILDSLDPPVKHELQQRGSNVSLLLFDIQIPAMVQRDLSSHELNDPLQFQVIVLHTLNRLRLRGMHAPLSVLPIWI